MKEPNIIAVVISFADTQFVNVNVYVLSVAPNVIIWFVASSDISTGALSYGNKPSVSVLNATYAYFFFEAFALKDTV